MNDTKQPPNPANSDPTGLTPLELVARLHQTRPLHFYPRALLDALLGVWDEAAPALVDHLERAIAEATACVERGEETPDNDGVLLSIILLRHKSETRGYAAMQSLVRAPLACADALMGDVLTESLSEIIVATLPATLDAAAGLLRLAVEPGINHWSRLATLNAIVYAVDDGKIERQAAIDAIAPLLNPDHAVIRASEEDLDLSSSVVNTLVDLRAEALVEELRSVSAEVVFDPYIATEHIAYWVAQPFEAGRALRQERRASSEELHDWLASWACYRPEEAAWRSPTGRPVAPSVRATTLGKGSVNPGVKSKALRVQKKKVRQMKKKSRKR